MEQIPESATTKPSISEVAVSTTTGGENKGFVRSTARDTDLKIHPEGHSVELRGLNNTCCFLNYYYNHKYIDDDFNYVVSDGRAGDIVLHKSVVKVWYVWFNCCHEEVIETQTTYHIANSGVEVFGLPKDILFDITKYVSIRANVCKKRHDLPLVRTCSNRLIWAWCTAKGLNSTFSKMCLCSNVVERRPVETLKCDSAYYMRKA